MEFSLKRLLLGKPLKSSESDHAKLPVWKALPILSSDAISSTAYGTEQILLELAVVGSLSAFAFSIPIAIGIIALITILIISYQQVITAYPQGGGAYMVTKENLGMWWGRLTGVSLLIDYTLTVAVSISAGVQAITSAFPATIPFIVPIAIGLVWLMALLNIRGTSESGNIFAMPTYFFIVCIMILIVKGLFDLFTGTISHQTIAILPATIPSGLTLFIILKAFSSGCSAVTGIEAISDAVPHIKSPSDKNAKRTLITLGILLSVIFAGVTVVAYSYNIIPSTDGHTSVLSMTAEHAFGRGIMYYALQISTMLILIMAANTSFNGFPILTSIMAKDKNFPKMFARRGDRLAYNYGIVMLAMLASILLLLFKGRTDALIPLYAIGVFLSFTLAQGGLVRKWIIEKPANWIYRSSINALGALVSLFVLAIFSATKFLEGAWIIVIAIPILVYFITKIYKHYESVENELQIVLSDTTISKTNVIIIPIADIHKGVAQTIAYAKTLSSNIVVFYVGESEEAIDLLENKWKIWNQDLRLEVFHSRYREVAKPLISFIERIDSRVHNQSTVTVLLTEFIPVKRWQKILHNRTASQIRKELMAHSDVVVSTMPYHLKN